MKKTYLLTPGPTPVPPSTLLNMAQPLIHHRTPQFQEIVTRVNEGLKYVFQTKNDIFTFASSGTGAMEASVVNLLSPSDKAVVVKGGKFGERFAEICQSYSIDVIPIDVEYGKAVLPEKIEDILCHHKNIKVVYTTLCETSTGVVNDIENIGKIVKKYDAALVVDAISGLGADRLKTDDWHVDVVVSGSQKGLMIPPGLAFVSLSRKAGVLVEKSKCPKYYFDFFKYKNALKQNDYPFTMAITLINGLDESLKMIREEGMEDLWLRHQRLAEATRTAVKAMGLKLFAPDAPSNAVTAIKVPDGIDGEKITKLMRDQLGVTIAGGQSQMKGKVIRIAHMGYMNQFDVLVGISSLEMALIELGYKMEIGVGISAGQEVLAGFRPAHPVEA